MFSRTEATRLVAAVTKAIDDEQREFDHAARPLVEATGLL